MVPREPAAHQSGISGEGADCSRTELNALRIYPILTDRVRGPFDEGGHDQAPRLEYRCEPPETAPRNVEASVRKNRLRNDIVESGVEVFYFEAVVVVERRPLDSDNLLAELFPEPSAMSQRWGSTPQ